MKLRCESISFILIQCKLTFFLLYILSNKHKFSGSCWYLPMERQESFSWRGWFCHCNLGAFWIAWIPPSRTGVPHPDSWSCSHFSVVKCIHLYQQVLLLDWSIYKFAFFLYFSTCILLSLMHLRSPPKIPQVIIPEDIVLGVASALRIEFNRALGILRDIASGKDLKKFLAVCDYLGCIL